MSIYAVSDLHLSFFRTKTMDKFGENWKDHHMKIEKNWNRIITCSDTVLIPGDISWAMSLKEAMPDLEFINNLKGKKIISLGNHDYWWSSIKKLNSLFDNVKFLKNNHYIVQEIGICGTRGWLCPNENSFTDDDMKIYKRELLRLENSFESLMNEKKSIGYIILMMHFPPTNEEKEISGFIELAKKYPVKQIVYGHLHGMKSFNNSILGYYENIDYSLVSCDFLNFTPKKIL